MTIPSPQLYHITSDHQHSGAYQRITECPVCVAGRSDHPLPNEVIEMMAKREHRMHHWLWHEVRNNWHQYPHDIQLSSPQAASFTANHLCYRFQLRHGRGAGSRSNGDRLKELTQGRKFLLTAIHRTVPHSDGRAKAGVVSSWMALKKD